MAEVAASSAATAATMSGATQGAAQKIHVKAGKRVNLFGAWNTSLTWRQIPNVKFSRLFGKPLVQLSKAKFWQGRIAAISIISNSDSDNMKVLGNADTFFVISSFV